MKPPEDNRPAPGANILLVDDEPANLLALGAVLETLGQNLVMAHSGEEALRRLLHDDFAVILLDVRMRDLDGFETARLIRGRDRSRHLPIIFVTAYQSSDFPVTRAYEMGAVDYLVKPILPAILRAKVASFVELFRKTEQVKQQAEQLRRLEYQTDLRESEARFRQLADAMPQMVWSARPDGYLDYYNERWYEFTGFRPGQGGDDSWTPILHPDDVQRCLDTWYQAVRSGTGYEIEYRFKDRHGGGYRWHLGRARPVRDEAGRVVRWFGTCTDIDDQKRAQEALEDAARREDEFLAMLAHELRNPLAPLLTSLVMLQQEGAVAPDRRRATDIMGRQVRHLSRLVDDLLDVSRIIHGQVQLRPGRLDLARLARTTAEDRRQALVQAGLTLEVDTPATPVWVTGDEARLAQVLNNLLDNAAKFTEAGGRVGVRLAVDEGARQAVLAVADTGVGIEPDMLGRMFEVFAQADQGLDRRRGGLGLGLSVVKGLVRLHDGEVRAASAGAGQGAEVTVRLPLAEEPAAPAALPAEVPPCPLRSRVLIIEDSRDAADSLRMLLEILGHEVRVAYSGSEGLRLAGEWPPEVVLSDIGLPGLDGYEVARRLRRQPGLEGVLLVALTGYGAEEDRLRSREAGFDHHLVKPADPADLRRVLALRAS